MLRRVPFKRLALFATPVLAGVAGLVAAASDAVPAPDGSACRPIRHTPAVIRSPGAYCLESDLNADADAIVIRSDHVSLDLKGYRLNGPTTPGTQTFGIRVKDASNIEIRNGTIAGFGIGVAITAPKAQPQKGSNTIENVAIVGSRLRGASLGGDLNRIENSQFRDIGGDSMPDVVHTHGLFIAGAGALVRGNTFSEIRGSQDAPHAEGIALAFSGDLNGSVAENNVFENTPLVQSVDGPKHRSPSTYAIWFGGSGAGTVVAKGNRISNFVNGVIADVHATAFIFDNTMTNTVAPFSTRKKLRQQPAAAGDRPIGAVSTSGNRCVTTDPIVQSLSGRQPLLACETPDDVSFAALETGLANQN